MPTYSFSLNRDQVITKALQLVNVIDENETPNANQIASATTSLNMLLKSWANDGLHLWKIRRYEFTLTAGQEKYNTTTLGVQKPLKLIEAYIHDNTGNTDVPLTIISRNEYMLLSSKLQQATPNQIYNNVNINDCDFYLFPCPDTNTQTNKKIVYWAQIPFEDSVNATDILDIPSEWTLACAYGLAYILADEYALPERRMASLGNKAEQFRAQAASFDVENSSVFFGPNRDGVD